LGGGLGGIPVSGFPGRSGLAAGCWDSLPDQARAEIVILLARIIARGVLAGAGQDPAPAAAEETVRD